MFSDLNQVCHVLLTFSAYIQGDPHLRHTMLEAKGKLEAQAHVTPIFQIPKVRKSEQNRPVLSFVQNNKEGNMSQMRKK